MILKNTKGKITIISENSDGKIEQISDCNIFLKGEEMIIFYSEDENSLDPDVKSTLKIRKDRVELIRKGSYTANMVFFEGHEHSFCYYTPYGVIDMKIKAKKVHFSNDRLDLVYDITNGDDTNENRMEITIERDACE